MSDSPFDRDALRATAAMIQARWPGRYEGDLALRLEELARSIEACRRRAAVES